MPIAPRSGGQGPEIASKALGPLGGPKVSKSITFSIESLKEFGTFPDRLISLHFLVADAMHAIDAQSVEQYSLVKVFLDVCYWSGLLLG